MVKSILSFLLFIILIIYKTECVEYTVSDITPFSAKDVYSDGNRCMIPMSILINVSTPGISLSGIDITVSPPYPINPSYSNKKINQGQLYYYTINIITPVNDSSIQLILNFNNSQTETYNFFDYTCGNIPEFWETELLDKEPYISYEIGSFESYRTGLKLTNYLGKYSLPSLLINCSTEGVTASLGQMWSNNGEYVIFLSFDQNFIGGIDQIQVVISSSGNIPTSVMIPNPFRNFNSVPVSYSISQSATYVINNMYYSIFKFQYDLSKQFEIVQSVSSVFSNMIPSEGIPGNCTLIGGTSTTTNTNYSKIFRIDSNGAHDMGLTIPFNYGLQFQAPTINSPWDLSFIIVQLSLVNDEGQYSVNEISGKSYQTITKFQISGNDKTQSYSNYPFGILRRYNETVFEKQFTIITSNYIGTNVLFRLDDTDFPVAYVPTPSYTDSLKPEIVSFSISSYNGATKVAKIHVIDKGGSGIFSLQFDTIQVMFGNLVYGNFSDGIYEIPFTYSSFLSYYSKNSYTASAVDNSFNVFNYQDFYSLNPLKYFVEPTIEHSNEFSPSNITQLYFSVPYGVTIDTTNKSVNVSLYIKTSSNRQVNSSPYLTFTKTNINGRINILELYKSTILFQGYWNNSLSMYQIDFTITPNQFTTIAKPYTIIWERLTIQSNSLIQQNKNASLSVYSVYADTMGPVLINLVKLITDSNGKAITIDDNSGNTNVGWNFNIRDYNGFENGTITISSKELSIDRVFKIDKSQGPLYNIAIKFTPQCMSQKLYISSVTLQDKYGYISTTVIDGLSGLQRVNPLLFINGTEPLEINLNCPNGITNNDPLTAIGPILNSFDFNPKEIDVGVENRLIKFEFSIMNIDSTLLPILYFGVLNFKYQPVECTIKNVSSDGTLVSYESSVVLDYGYGYVGKRILVSLYGLYDVWGNVKGYSTNQLKVNNFPNLISVTSFSLNVPIINSVSDIYSYGGIISIFGNGFGVDGIDTIAQVDYSDGLGYNTLAHLFNSGVYKVVKIRPTDYSFNIRIINTASNIISSIKTVNPINSITRPPITPPPTNSPTSSKCLGSPECSSNGYCNPSTITCVCYSPWSGIDCSSKIIIIPPPIIDQSKPFINITLGGSNKNSSTEESSVEYQEDELVTSLINVVSLREIDIDNGVIDQYTFDQWIFNNVTSFNDINLSYLYTHTIVQPQDTDYNCTVNVLVQWFKKESNVIFANSNLTIPESSIKYNINITHWPFKSNLNTLQLIMLVSIQSSITKDTCSSKQFGVADEINQYLKLSVNKKSIYGIFINRGIVDSRIVEIRNTQLDSLLNETTKLKNDPSTSSSYIAVNIPNFRGIAQLDPSFSVLVDSKENTDNSICTPTKSGLTSAQIAGIVVGCVVGVSIIITAIIFVLKTTKGKIMLKAIKLNKL